MAHTIFDPDTTVLFGGQIDPEILRIKALAEEHGYRFIPATKNGKPVNPVSAYEADPPDLPSGITTLILVECRPVSTPEGLQVIQVDHHYKGDPGSGLPDDQFFKASSLGQIYNLLFPDLTPLHEDLVLAAMDDRPNRAILGRCPGVTAKEVLDRKVAEIVAQLKRLQQLPEDLPEIEAKVRERIDYWAGVIRISPVIMIGGFPVIDLRAHFTGAGYDRNYLTAQTAALRDGYVVFLATRDQGDERNKWVLTGHASAELVHYAYEVWSTSEEATRNPGGLYGRYRSEERGYMGGYTEPNQ